MRSARAVEKVIGPAAQSAEAALLNARALINAERAWIMADVNWEPRCMGLMRSESSGGRTTTNARVNVSFRNKGRTPAWITEIAIKMQVTNAGPSQQPDTKGAEMLYGPIPLVPDEEHPHVRTFEISADGWPDKGWATLIYGVVKYRDVFAENRPDRETWFGYRVTSERSLERMAHPEYNKNT